MAKRVCKPAKANRDRYKAEFSAYYPNGSKFCDETTYHNTRLSAECANQDKYRDVKPYLPYWSRFRFRVSKLKKKYKIKR